MNERHYTFNDGLPTKPDVDLLLRTWPDPQIGDVFDYETIAKLIGAQPMSKRFNTVTQIWRRRMLEHGRVIEPQAGERFYVAEPKQVSANTYSTLTFIKRKAHKFRRKLQVAHTQTKDPQERATIEHQTMLMGAIELDAKKARMNVLPSTKVAELPNLSPKNGAGQG